MSIYIRTEELKFCHFYVINNTVDVENGEYDLVFEKVHCMHGQISMLKAYHDNIVLALTCEYCALSKQLYSSTKYLLKGL